MVENQAENEKEIWVKFLQKHWKITLLMVSGLIVAGIGGLFVFLWVKDVTIATSPVLATFGQWTIGYVVTFILNLILWEFLIIGIPVIAAVVVIILQWWNKLPDDEKEEYKKEPKKRTPRSGMTAGGGGGIVWFLTFLVWLIIVFNDGNWNLVFQAWPVDYLIYSSLTAFLWVLLVAGIPVTIFVIWWIRREMKSP